MDVALTWDLVIVAGFAVIFAYNLMLGQRDTVKLIICTYMSMMAADGIAGTIKTYIFDTSLGLQATFGDQEVAIFTWMRLLLFILIIILFVVKSGFHVDLDRHEKMVIRVLIHALFSGILALLLLATVVVYLGGISVTEGLLFARDLEIYESSIVARILLDHLQIWFTLPALAFLITSFFHGPKEVE
ncbi:MAG TPA: hypothetical protein VIT68_04575 [Candidatus Gracilibacteria bacterium]